MMKKSLSTGEILNDRYRIVSKLGGGGFGLIYRVWDLNLETPRALKENLNLSTESQKQFKREALILSTLTHPNLPKVLDHFVIPGQGQYLVMAYVEGEDLQHLQNRIGKPLPENQVLEWMKQICNALAYLQSQPPPIIHRDIKPANIRITPGGQAILVDFGIAKLFDPKLRTTIGARAVTPGYSPIEQYASLGRTDVRTDIYAIGATLYTLLTNKIPVEAPERNLGNELASIHSLNPEVSRHVEEVVMKAMSVYPEERYQTVEDFKISLFEGKNLLTKRGEDENGLSKIESPESFYDGIIIERTHPVDDYYPSTSTSDKVAKKRLLLKGLFVTGFVWLAILLVLAGLMRSKIGFINPIETISSPQIYQQKNTSISNSLIVTSSTTSTLIPLMPLKTATQIPPSAPTSVDSPKIIDNMGIRMALIPSGNFLMGSEKGDAVERPVHEIFLDDYYIDVNEITNSQYAECVYAGNCESPRKGESYTRTQYYGVEEFSQFPVIHVTWEMARIFCEWRGARLPTEAEWEKAARGGLTESLYPWGDLEPTCTTGAENGANFNDCLIQDTIAIGNFVSNGYGLYDMAGNVWEWTWDWYSETYYGLSPFKNPLGPVSGEYRVLRGGSAASIKEFIRVINRWRDPPDWDGSYAGIRCVYAP